MKKLITLSTLLLCGITLAACNTNTGKKDVTAETTTIVQETTSQETAEATTTVPTKDTQWIGSDDYGYMKVPKSWVQSDAGGNNVDFMYSDGTDKNAISVKSINADGKDLTNLQTNFEQKIKENPRFTNVRTDKGNIGGYDAVKIYADYNNNSRKVVIWLFKSDDNMIRLVTLEGNLEIVNEITPIVEESWTVKKN
ncbi:hypothetical protein NML71_04315 [Streptococcus sp. CF4-2]|jgi:hypothetical protein|uniref:hypothetical protein n=1 Tax=unclassified Streptococcus TaxID=2608887 RepID=UPI0020C9804F|nr:MULTISPECIES: hypothetical protein [unclassified Streptococcus]MCP9075584.1 hypothetical protein [Streptococcus sp. CF4-3]MCP9088397.1 hypothetical protein [Streptococcus sp. CF4-2]